MDSRIIMASGPYGGPYYNGYTAVFRAVLNGNLEGRIIMAICPYGGPYYNHVEGHDELLS